jgi:hypothetical protein
MMKNRTGVPTTFIGMLLTRLARFVAVLGELD